MSAYAVHERIEEARWQQHDASVKKDEWIRDRAETLKELWPIGIEEIRHPSINHAMAGLNLEAAQDAYAEMVDKICLAQAELDWRDMEWLGEDWTP